MKKNAKLLLTIIAGIVIGCSIGSLIGYFAWQQYQADETYKFNIWDGVESMKHKKAELLVYKSANWKNTEKVPAVVILPGGNYSHYGLVNEGRCSARWFIKHDVTAFVLKYRVSLKGGHAPDMMQDIQRTIQLLKDNCTDFNIDPENIGVIGYSAGGHLCIWAGEEGDRTNLLDDLGVHTEASLMPNWICPVYPVVSMDSEICHMRSRHNLLKKWNPDQEKNDQYSLELHVTDNMPPTYLVACHDDPKVKFENSRRFCNAMKEKNQDITFMEYEKGGHGFGMMNKEFLDTTHWNESLGQWLKDRGFWN